MIIMKNFLCRLSLLVRLTIVISMTVQKGKTYLTVSDKITTDTDFYFHSLSVIPSKLSTIEFSVKFNINDIRVHCDSKKISCYLYVDIYTTKDDRNLRTNCSNSGYRQLANEDLHSPLRPGSYRYTTCKLDDVDSEMLHCEGRIMIQDYKPRHYGFSFGYSCKYLNRSSLHGLLFNFTIFEQTNETTCTNIPPVNDEFFQCYKIYPYTSLPNMMGIRSTSDYKQVVMGTVISPLVTLLLTSNGRLCHKYARETLCHIFTPKCDIIKGQIIHPCKETCSEVAEACSESIISVLEKIQLRDKRWRGGFQHYVDYDYLPSFNGSVPCYYQPVTRESPPNITNSRIVNGVAPNITYQAKSKVEYECLDETFHIEGNSTVTCLYNGEWEETPMCKRRDESLNPLSIVLPLLLIPMFLLIVILLLRTLACGTQENLTRIKEYDAFVCYEYNEKDENFAEDIIRYELEEKCDPPFKLCLHRRDFKAAWDIMWNIRNAIKNSNSAIIVMSQEFVDSLWCKEEFEQCYMEHMKDPAFKLFVIMMQPVEELNRPSEYMKSFFESKTYLNNDDPKLYQKIGEYLSYVKEPKMQRKKQPEEEKEVQEMEELI